MRVAKTIYGLIGVGLLSFPVLVRADNAAQPLRDEYLNKFMSKPISAKKLYREAWSQDNNAQMSLVEQLEYFQKHNPGFDEATMNIMKRGTEMMKKMDFGLKGAELSDKVPEIQANPARAIQKLSDKQKDKVSAQDGLAAVDVIDSAKTVMDNVYQSDSLNQKTHQIDIDSF